MVDSPDNTGPDTSKVEPEAKQKELPKGAKLGDIIRKKFKAAGLQVKTAMGDDPDEIVINPMVESLEGHLNRHTVVSFGRMGIFTAGHKKVTDKIKEVAKTVGGKAAAYLSKSHDPKKNPLSYEDKLKYAKIGSGGVVKHTDANNILQVASQHHHDTEHLHVVAGSDRVEHFKKLLNDYNGKAGPHGYYNYKSITVHSAGERDPDSEGTDGISASKMREHASNNDAESFKQGLPDSLKPHAGEMMHKVRKGMKLEESLRSLVEELFEVTSRNLKPIPTPGNSNLSPTKYPKGAGDVGMDHDPEIENVNGPIDQANKTVQRKRGRVVKLLQGPLDIDEMGTLDQRAILDLHDTTPKKTSKLTPWERIQKKREQNKSKNCTCNMSEHIVRLPSGKFRLLSHTGKNLGTFDSHAAAAKHEGEVEYFKHKGE